MLDDDTYLYVRCFQLSIYINIFPYKSGKTGTGRSNLLNSNALLPPTVFFSSASLFPVFTHFAFASQIMYVYYLTCDDYSPAVHGQYDHILLFINLHRMDALCTTFSTSTHAPIEHLDRLQSGAKIKFFFRTHLVTGMYYYL